MWSVPLRVRHAVGTGELVPARSLSRVQIGPLLLQPRHRADPGPLGWSARFSARFLQFESPAFETFVGSGVWVDVNTKQHRIIVRVRLLFYVTYEDNGVFLTGRELVEREIVVAFSYLLLS